MTSEVRKRWKFEDEEVATVVRIAREHPILSYGDIAEIFFYLHKRPISKFTVNTLLRDAGIPPKARGKGSGNILKEAAAIVATYRPKIRRI